MFHRPVEQPPPKTLFVDLNSSYLAVFPAPVLQVGVLRPVSHRQCPCCPFHSSPVRCVLIWRLSNEPWSTAGATSDLLQQLKSAHSCKKAKDASRRGSAQVLCTLESAEDVWDLV